MKLSLKIIIIIINKKKVKRKTIILISFLWSFWINHIYCLLFPLPFSTRSFLSTVWYWICSVHFWVPYGTESVACNFEVEIIYVYISITIHACGCENKWIWLNKGTWLNKWFLFFIYIFSYSSRYFSKSYSALDQEKE